MAKIPVKIKKLHSDAKIPGYKSAEAAAFDVHSIESLDLGVGETSKIGTGLAIEIPKGFCWQVWDRGSMGAKGIKRMGGLGDSDYRGEIKIVLHNTTKEPFRIEKGDRIAQVCILPVLLADLQEVQELSDSERGTGGFGSTGVR